MEPGETEVRVETVKALFYRQNAHTNVAKRILAFLFTAASS